MDSKCCPTYFGSYRFSGEAGMAVFALVRWCARRHHAGEDFSIECPVTRDDTGVGVEED